MVLHIKQLLLYSKQLSCVPSAFQGKEVEKQCLRWFKYTLTDSPVKTNCVLNYSRPIIKTLHSLICKLHWFKYGVEVYLYRTCNTS